jgi:hypothetical protein
MCRPLKAFAHLSHVGVPAFEEEGLVAFRDTFRPTCADLDVTESADGVQQIIDRGEIRRTCRDVFA